jgi:hypothetical protein
LILSVDKNPRGRYLVLSHPTNSKIIYDINFTGGLLLLGLNNDYILNNLELNIYREYWKRLDAKFLKPQQINKRSVKFLNINASHYEFDIPLSVYTDNTQSAVFVEIETYAESDSHWVAISENCFMRILNNQLIGFWINLSSY